MFNPPNPSAPAARRGRKVPAWLLALPCLLGFASAASAATLTVTNTGDGGAGSLRAAVAAAGDGDTITFDAGAFPANGNTVIALASRLNITKPLTIQGPGASGVTLSDSSDGILGVTGSNTANITVLVSGLTLANGNGASGVSNGNGGGIYTFAANLTLTGCALSGNTANAGGAISSSSSTVSLTNCTLSGNTASVGGAISSSSGTVSLTNCTLSGNTANAGGGVYNTGSLLLTNCTLVGNTAGIRNSAGQGGGLFEANGSAASIQSCLIAGNAATGMGADVFGAVTSGGSNLIGDSGAAAEGFTQAHDQVGVDPKLDPKGLAGNGGPTQTIAVLPGSPAIGGDYNDATATDQRGITRTAAQHTIGAYEYKSSHTHLLWNNTDGRVILWSVAQDGTFTFNVFGPYTDGTPNTPWTAKALATGPDGLSHILWTNPDGRVILWTVDDQGNFTYQVYGPYTDDGTAATPWSATALSVGADNLVHILWTNPDGRVILWNVDPAFNFTYQAFGPYTDGGPSTPWKATAIATGPDNVTRLLWNNPDGRVILWNIDDSFNFTLQVYGPYNDGSPSTPWSASAVSVGPDNITHLLWNNPDGRVILWNVDSGFNLTYQVYGPYTDGSPNTPWNAAALATGPDDVSHLLWTNPDNRVILWAVDSGFNFTYQVFGPYNDGAPQDVWTPTAISAGP